MTRRPAFGIAVLFGLTLALPGGRLHAGQNAQTPTFRSSVDLVAVNVQVVDHDGRPIPAITADKFDVTIGGKRRHVVSADFLQTGAAESSVTSRAPTVGAVSTNVWPTNTVGRSFILAVDVASFGPEDSRNVMNAASSFLQELQANDSVALFAFPVGPRVDATLDHTQVIRALNTIVGSRQAMHSEYNLTAADVIDVNAELTSTGLRTISPGSTLSILDATANAPAIQRIALRECGADVTAANLACVMPIMDEATSLGLSYEAQVTEGMSQIHGLLTALSHQPGRKTVVVISAGMPSTDRPGGRPDIADLAADIGRNAAEANATIYAIYVASHYLQQNAAETRRADKGPVDLARGETVEWQFLDQFAGAAGGTLIRDLVGSGEIAFDRVLRETSAYYLLGVEPTDADRDGRTRELKVKVNAPNVTVRSRSWVALPKKS
jgi:VWFA-related protein